MRKSIETSLFIFLWQCWEWLAIELNYRSVQLAPIRPHHCHHHRDLRCWTKPLNSVYAVGDFPLQMIFSCVCVRVHARRQQNRLLPRFIDLSNIQFDLFIPCTYSCVSKVIFDIDIIRSFRNVRRIDFTIGFSWHFSGLFLVLNLLNSRSCSNSRNSRKYARFVVACARVFFSFIACPNFNRIELICQKQV